jgi:thiamine-phosphate pyrophosphorylase
LEVPNPPLLLVADIGLAGDRLKAILEASLEAGCRWIMVRGKTASASIIEETTAMALKLSKKYDAYVYVNSHPEIVSKMEAHGLHLPWGWSVSKSREIVGVDVPIGVSTHSLEEAVKAYLDGADYITLSPIYESISKPGYRQGLGLHELKKVVEKVSIPVIALGGVCPGRARPCICHGARGVAVMGAVIQSTDPYRVVKTLVEETSRARA